MRNIFCGTMAILSLVVSPVATAEAAEDVFVMPQERAQKIVSALDSWTLKSGERPKAWLIARDCFSASGIVMQDYVKKNGHSAGIIDEKIMANMSFWSSIAGAVAVRHKDAGEIEGGDAPTAFTEPFAKDEVHQAILDGNLPPFISDYYSECDGIRKRFGG